MFSKPQLMDYEIRNVHEFGQDINNIKIEDDNFKWTPQINQNQIDFFIKLKTQERAYIQKIQIKAEDFQEITISYQYCLGRRIFQKIEMINQESHTYTISFDQSLEDNYLGFNFKMKEKQQGKEEQIPIIYHVLIYEQLDQNKIQQKIEKTLSRLVKLKQTTPENMIAKRKILYWYKNLNPVEQYKFQTGQFTDHIQDIEGILQLLFQNTEECMLHTIYLLGIRFNSILNSFVTPKYQNLIHLHLSNSNICNVEPLSFINAPQLYNLNLVSNQITNIKPLIKLCSQLKYLLLDCNMIQDFNLLAYVQIDSYGLDLPLYQPKVLLNFFAKIKKIHQQYQNQSFKKRFFIDYKNVESYNVDIYHQKFPLIIPSQRMFKTLSNKIKTLSQLQQELEDDLSKYPFNI